MERSQSVPAACLGCDIHPNDMGVAVPIRPVAMPTRHDHHRRADSWTRWRVAVSTGRVRSGLRSGTPTRTRPAPQQSTSRVVDRLPSSEAVVALIMNTDMPPFVFEWSRATRQSGSAAVVVAPIRRRVRNFPPPPPPPPPGCPNLRRLRSPPLSVSRFSVIRDHDALPASRRAGRPIGHCSRGPAQYSAA